LPNSAVFLILTRPSKISFIATNVRFLVRDLSSKRN